MEIVRDRLPDGIRLVDVGRRQLRGLSRPERVFELRAPADAPHTTRHDILRGPGRHYRACFK